MSTPSMHNIRGFFIWGLCALFFTYEFLLRTVIGTFQHPISYDLELTSFKFTLLSSTVYLAVYGLMQLPVGLIVDRYGLKKSLVFASLTCAISVFGFAYADSFIMAVACRVLTAFGSAFGFVCLLVAVFDWLPAKRKGLYIGLSQFIGTMGPMIAAGPLSSLSTAYDVNWRMLFILLAAVGLVLSVCIFFFVENNRDRRSMFVVLRKPGAIKSSLKDLLSRSQVFYIGIFSALVYFNIEYLSENEGAHFLALKGIPKNLTSYLISLAWLGYAIGCPLIGYFSDVFHRRKSLMMLAALSYIIAISGIIFSANITLLFTAFFLLGIGASGQSIGFAIMAENTKKQNLALGLSLNNAFLCIFGAVNAPLIGFVVSMSKSREVAELADIQMAFIGLILVALLAFFVVTVFIRETFCKSAVERTTLNP